MTGAHSSSRAQHAAFDAEATLYVSIPKSCAMGLAFLSPEITSAILEGIHPKELSLARIPKLLPLPWTEHRHLLG